MEERGGKKEKEGRGKKTFCVLGCVTVFTFYGGGNSLTLKEMPVGSFIPRVGQVGQDGIQRRRTAG